MPTPISADASSSRARWRVSNQGEHTIRFAVAGFALTLALLLAVGCRDASPTLPGPPPIRAEEVVDRETLRLFVERAGAAVTDNGPDLQTAYAFLDANFRSEGEWRHGEIYVFVDTMELVNFFHATNPDVEGSDRSGGVDPNGVNVGEELRAAAAAGGGYVEYLHDNPAVEGDEETRSRKLAYATALTIGSVPMFLTSGIYLDHPGE